ncbi:MAG: hypothetical protein FWE18_03665 [Alphaproteobacteria bacterium]|nr:hypothetical protein [Alphaproteobacteria bacterium]
MRYLIIIIVCFCAFELKAEVLTFHCKTDDSLGNSGGFAGYNKLDNISLDYYFQTGKERGFILTKLNNLSVNGVSLISNLKAKYKIGIVPPENPKDIEKAMLLNAFAGDYNKMEIFNIFFNFENNKVVAVYSLQSIEEDGAISINTISSCMKVEDYLIN